MPKPVATFTARGIEPPYVAITETDQGSFQIEVRDWVEEDADVGQVADIVLERADFAALIAAAAAYLSA